MKKFKPLLLMTSLIIGLTSCTFARTEETKHEENPDFHFSLEGRKTFKTLGIIDSGIDQYTGYAYKTYLYTISNNTKPSVSINITFEDGRDDGDDYLVGEVNSQQKKFTITCKQDFDSVATARLYLTDTPESYVDITINYSQKIINGGLPTTLNNSYVLNASANSDSDYWMVGLDNLSLYDYLILNTTFNFNVSKYTNHSLGINKNLYSFVKLDIDADPTPVNGYWPGYGDNETLEEQFYYAFTISNYLLKDRVMSYDQTYLNNKLYKDAFINYCLYQYPDQFCSFYWGLNRVMQNLTQEDRQEIKLYHTVPGPTSNRFLRCTFAIDDLYVTYSHPKSEPNLTNGTIWEELDANDEPTGYVHENIKMDHCHFHIFFEWLDAWDN